VTFAKSIVTNTARKLGLINRIWRCNRT